MDELITEEQILALTNNQKREAFLKKWTLWPVLAKVPILQLTARQIVLPNKKRIVSLEYGTPLKDYRNCYFQELNLTEGISPFSDISDNLIIDALKDLRMEIVTQRKKMKADGNTGNH